MTKKGDVWAIATVEDLEGAIEVMFFPQTYNLYATTLAEDAVVVVAGRLDRREDVPKLIAMEMTLPDLSEGPRGPVVISLPVARCTPPVVERLKEVLATHPGATEVHLRLQAASRTTVLRHRRRAAGQPLAGADGRPQGAARPGLPRLRHRDRRAIARGGSQARPGCAPIPFRQVSTPAHRRRHDGRGATRDEQHRRASRPALRGVRRR